MKRRAGNGTRTRDPNLGKVVLYQLSYSRVNPKWNVKTSTIRTFERHSSASSGHAFAWHTRLAAGMEARGIEPLTS